VSEGRLEAMEAPPPTPWTLTFGYLVGGTAVILGTVTVIFIVFSVVT